MAIRGVLMAVLVVTSIGGCATPEIGPGPAPEVVNLLRNPGFEADPAPGRECPPFWWCTMHADPTSFHFSVTSEPRSKGRFLKVTRVKNEPWAMVTQTIPAAGLAGRRIRLSASVDAGAFEGKAGPAIILQGAGGRAIDHRQALLEPGPGWRRTNTEIVVAEGTQIVEIALIAEGGGTVGFDDVEVSVSPPTR